MAHICQILVFRVPDGRNLTSLLRSEPLRPGLQTTLLRPAKGLSADFTHFLLVASGGIKLRIDADEHDLSAPAGAVIPPEPPAALALQPGTVGWLIGAGPVLMAEAVGDKAESVLLHAMTGRLIIAQQLTDRFADDFLYPAEQVHREHSLSARASQLAVAAYLRLMLIAFWREGNFDQVATQGRSNELHVIQGFRRLVELHFRKQLPIARYAAFLGISYDRLHDICKRTLQRAPLRLVHQRMIREAAIRLERSGETVQEIAHSLGFADPTQFSHFFKKNSGLSPSHYRAKVRLNETDQTSRASSFSDWP